MSIAEGEKQSGSLWNFTPRRILLFTNFLTFTNICFCSVFITFARYLYTQFTTLNVKIDVWLLQKKTTKLYENFVHTSGHRSRYFSTLSATEASSNTVLASSYTNFYTSDSNFEVKRSDCSDVIQIHKKLYYSLPICDSYKNIYMKLDTFWRKWTWIYQILRIIQYTTYSSSIRK